MLLHRNYGPEKNFIFWRILARDHFNDTDKKNLYVCMKAVKMQNFEKKKSVLMQYYSFYKNNSEVSSQLIYKNYSSLT